MESFTEACGKDAGRVSGAQRSTQTKLREHVRRCERGGFVRVCVYVYYPGQKKKKNGLLDYARGCCKPPKKKKFIGGTQHPLLCIKSEHCSYHTISKNQAWLRFDAAMREVAASRATVPISWSVWYCVIRTVFDFIHNLSGRFFFSLHIFRVTDILAGFAINNKVLLLPAIVSGSKRRVE